jgi:geranylgeranyl diphosphate synthase, type II
MSQNAQADFKVQLTDNAQAVNRVLEQLLAEQQEIERSLKKAMEYSLYAPGKRIRAGLVLWSCAAVCGRANRDAEIAAAAIEMIHTYSLVHDDLPAMDDDDVRRGKPTCHKAFDEATAILAGDGLLTLAFEVLGEKVGQAERAVLLMTELARAAGPSGMIAGQMADVKAENTTGDEETLKYIHTNKTAKMFQCAAAMGGICADADAEQLAALREYGLKLGLGFQIADDILDVCGSSERMGKTAGKDQQAGKLTYPAVVGLEESKCLEARLADEAVGALSQFGKDADILRAVARGLVQRTH